MYVVENSVDRNSLCQGDILSACHIFGAINPNSITYLSDAAGQQTGWQCNVTALTSQVAVLSHCCEIDPKNLTKLTSIILAPLRDIDKATDPSKKVELIASNEISERTGSSYLKYFYLVPHSNIPFEGGAVVDFSKCFSVRKNYYDSLLLKKILQLTPETRESFSIKLALYFYRNKKAS